MIKTEQFLDFLIDIQCQNKIIDIFFIFETYISYYIIQHIFGHVNVSELLWACECVWACEYWACECV